MTSPAETLALCAKVDALLEKATPLCALPEPWNEDRRYGADEIARLEADKAIRAALPALLRAAREGVEARRWIPVGERLPNSDGDYLVCARPMLDNEQLFVYSATYEKPEHAFINGWSMGRVTHWMPLPEAPK